MSASHLQSKPIKMQERVKPSCKVNRYTVVLAETYTDFKKIGIEDQLKILQENSFREDDFQVLHEIGETLTDS